MEIITLYYVVDDVASTGLDLPSGLRIFKINFIIPGNIIKFQTGDGPYNSLDQLRKDSPRYKKLLSSRPKRAQQICEDRFIINVADKVISPGNIDKELEGQLFHVLEHIISGRINKNNVSGIHRFEPRLHKIIAITKEPNEHGIWEAQISAYNSNRDEWIPKNRASTFFPLNWSNELLVLKIHEAFKNKVCISDSKYVGKTSCDIEIIFIIQDKKIKSIYPIYAQTHNIN